MDDIHVAKMHRMQDVDVAKLRALFFLVISSPSIWKLYKDTSLFQAHSVGVDGASALRIRSLVSLM